MAPPQAWCEWVLAVGTGSDKGGGWQSGRWRPVQVTRAGVTPVPSGPSPPPCLSLHGLPSWDRGLVLVHTLPVCSRAPAADFS